MTCVLRAPMRDVRQCSGVAGCRASHNQVILETSQKWPGWAITAEARGEHLALHFRPQVV
jgi:hypothetical protein